MTEHKWLTKSSVSVALASLALASTVTAGYLMFELKTNPQLKDGSVTLDWQIDTNGDALRPEVVRSEMKSPPFENCLAAKIARWQFAPTLVVKYVEHRFNFKNQP